MIITEVIPAIVNWSEIKDHCNIDDDDTARRNYLTAVAGAAAEAFERETGYATGQRTVTVSYATDECNGGTVLIPKGPVVSITSLSCNGSTVSPEAYELCKIGHQFYLSTSLSSSSPIVLTYVCGHATVPPLIKQAILIHTAQMNRLREGTTGQSQSTVEFGLERMYSLYNVHKIGAS